MFAMTTVTELPDPINRVISATVKALYTGKGMTADDVASRIGVSHGTMNSRLRCITSWTAAEVRRMADLFEVRIADLYDGMGGTFDPKPPTAATSKRQGRSYSSSSSDSATELMQYQSPVAA